MQIDKDLWLNERSELYQLAKAATLCEDNLIRLNAQAEKHVLKCQPNISDLCSLALYETPSDKNASSSIILTQEYYTTYNYECFLCGKLLANIHIQYNTLKSREDVTAKCAPEIESVMHDIEQDLACLETQMDSFISYLFLDKMEFELACHNVFACYITLDKKIQFWTKIWTDTDDLLSHLRASCCLSPNSKK